MSSDSIDFRNRGLLKGHTDWVTAIVAGKSKKDEDDSKLLVSGSRDKTLIVWRLNPDAK
jgi:WD40 repeat protein